jgi:hypothetical protein
VETALFPDGGYTVKVAASDAPSHSPNDALRDEKESAHFEIDTTPPVISGLAATVQGGNALRISFQASDSFSPIRRAEYSIDAGDWKFVEPVGLLSDAKAESYDFSVPLAAAAGAQPAPHDPGEHVVVVRVYDRYSNLATAKTVVHAR